MINIDMKIKKTTKPVYKVDITNVDTLSEMKAAFALAKHNAKLPLSNDELISIITYVIDEIPKTYICSVSYEVTRKPWYKRFWNWITCKKD